MTDLINIIAFILPVISIFSVLLLTISNLYLKFRKRFPVRVNCWFCNTNTRVPYSIHNSWTCAKCLQYNGFNEDGDYNQDIPEQRDPYMNISYSSHCPSHRSPMLPASNGLCVTCNKNQKLKVQQLASFTPISDTNYDSEVEAFKQHLENKYKLCRKCKKTLKAAINKTKTILISSRLSYMRNRGLNFIDLNAATNSITPNKKQKFVLTISKYTLVSLAMLLVYVTIEKYDFSEKSIQDNVHSYFSSYITTIISYLSVTRDFIIIQLTITKTIFVNMFYSMSHHEQIQSFFEDNVNILQNEYSNELIITSAGCLLSVVLTLWQWSTIFRKDVVNTLFWSTAYGASLWERHDESLAELNIFDIFKLIVTFSLLLTTINLKPQKLQKRKIKRDKRKYVEESDVSDFEEELDVTDTSKKNTAEFSTDSINSDFSTSTIKKSPPKRDLYNNTFAKSYFTDIGGNKSLLNNTVSTTTDSTDSYTDVPISQNKILTSNYEFGKCYFGNNNQVQQPEMFIVNNMTIKEPEIDLTNLSLSQNNSRIYSENPLFVTRQYSNDVSPIFTTKMEQVRQRKRPILSPSRLDKPVTQASWVAGGYWSPTKSPPISLDYGFAPISRTSSQSSGFESQGSLAMPDLIPPVNSSDEFDRSSVLSEPAYYGNNFNNHHSRASHRRIVYPIIREDRPTFIRPSFPSSRNVPSPINTFRPVQPNKTDCKSSIFNFNQMNQHLNYTKGSLLKKWCGENQVCPIDPMENLQL